MKLFSAAVARTNRYWHLLDGWGSVVGLLDGSGTEVDQYAYDLWGAPTQVSESVRQQLRYRGYWYDNETGWYWLRIRAYDPVLKRFIEPDASGRDGQFSYASAGNDPIDGSDPTWLVNYSIDCSLFTATAAMCVPHDQPRLFGHGSRTRSCSGSGLGCVPVCRDPLPCDRGAETGPAQVWRRE